MIKAAPGIYLVELLQEKTSLNLGDSKEKKILKGKILDVGPNREHDDGGKLVSVYKKGDTIFFFSYVDGADMFEDNGQKYYCVIFNDARAQLL